MKNPPRSLIQRACILLPAVLLLLPVLPGGTAFGAVIWHEWVSADSSPSGATPAWGVTTANGGSNNRTPPERLQLVSTALLGASDQNIFWRMNNATYWDPLSEEGTTIEFSMRVVSMYAPAATGAARFQVRSGNWAITLNIKDDSVNFGSETGKSLTTTDWNIYRLVFSSDGAATLYVNEAPEPFLTYNATSDPIAAEITFGDPGNAWGGTTEWQYVKWTNNGQFAPVPEPSAAALLLPGALACYLLRKRAVRRCGGSYRPPQRNSSLPVEECLVPPLEPIIMPPRRPAG